MERDGEKKERSEKQSSLQKKCSRICVEQPAHERTLHSCITYTYLIFDKGFEKLPCSAPPFLSFLSFSFCLGKENTKTRDRHLLFGNIFSKLLLRTWGCTFKYFTFVFVCSKSFSFLQVFSFYSASSSSRNFQQCKHAPKKVFYKKCTHYLFMTSKSGISSSIQFNSVAIVISSCRIQRFKWGKLVLKKKVVMLMFRKSPCYL